MLVAADICGRIRYFDSDDVGLFILGKLLGDGACCTDEDDDGCGGFGVFACDGGFLPVEVPLNKRAMLLKSSARDT